MKRLYIYLTAMAISIFTLSACAENSPCFTYDTQSEMNICAQNEVTLLSNKLTSDEQKLIERFRQQNSEDLVSSLQESISAWKTFSKAHCRSVSQIYEGGSLHSFALAQCQIPLLHNRIKQLKTDYQDTLKVLEDGAP